MIYGIAENPRPTGKRVKYTPTSLRVKTARIVTCDIRMEFLIEKCAHANIQRGNVTKTEEIQLPDGNNINDIDEAG